MAKIRKEANTVTITMTIDEVGLLNKLVEDAGNVAARARHSHGNNDIALVKAEIAMKAMWSLSDHLSVPTDPKHSYEQEFQLP